MKKSIVVVACLFFVSMLLGGFSQAADKVTVLEFSSGIPPFDPLSVIMGEFCKEIEKKSNGRVKVNFHPGATMTPQSQTYDSIVKGIVDMGDTTLESTPGRFPFMEVLSLPLGLKDSYMATRLTMDFYRKFKPKELNQVKVLALIDHGPGGIHTRKPVNKLEDLKGMKLRCTGGAVVDLVKALGGVPVMMPAIDTYDGLRKGVVDGVVSQFNVANMNKFDEVANYSTRNERTGDFHVQIIAINQAKWDSLPRDLQEMIGVVSEEYTEKIARLWDSQDAEAIQRMTAKGHKIITLSAEEGERWSQRVAPLLDTYVKEKEAKGLPAAEAVQFSKDWVKKNQK